MLTTRDTWNGNPNQLGGVGIGSEMQQKRIKTHISGEVVSLSFPKERDNSVHRHRTGLGSSLTSFTR